MMNLQDGLAGIAGPAVEPTPGQVAADITRGQRALRRRRLVQAGGGSAFAVAALAAAVALATTGGTGPVRDTPLAQDQGSVTASVAPGIKLVAYTGEQPEGFTLDEVPDGWEVQGVDAGVLTLAPKNAADKNIHNFEGKVVVTLQSVDETGTPQGEKIDVAGKPAVLGKAEGMTTGWWLYVDQPSGPRMHVQVWDGLGWNKSDVIEFADGVHVTEDAKASVG